MPSRDKLAEFVAWCAKLVTGDETFRSGSAAQIFLDRLFQAFGPSGSLAVGGTTEFRIRKATEDGGGPAKTLIVNPPTGNRFYRLNQP